MGEVCQVQDNCSYLEDYKKEVDSYQKCVENTLLDLNSLNMKYEKTVREISSIFDLFQHINMINDYYNLHTVINDMLIGVLGLTDSTIFSVNKDQLLVEASSISRQDLKGIKAIETRIVNSACMQGKMTIFPKVQITEEISRARNINSAVAIPLMKKDQCSGIIYLEHSMPEHFNHEDSKFLNTLAVAVRLSIENAQLYASLEDMVLRDGLTGLYNHAYFNKELNNCIDIYNKYSIPFILAIADIDHFAQINNTYGHICGDEIIKQVGKLISLEIRKGDIVCRYDGGKYAMIFRNTSDLKAINSRLETIRSKTGQLTIDGGAGKPEISCSFGLASFNDCDMLQDYQAVVNCAEQALEKAKQNGANNVVTYVK